MITYTRKPMVSNPEKTHYFKKDSTKTVPPIVSVHRIPPIVLKQFDETNATSIDYDDKPEKRRCVFCEGYQAYKRVFMGELVDLCEDHYYSKSLGAIAAQMKLIHRERDNGILIETPRTSSKKR